MAKKIVKGKNDFGTTHPEISKEWHPTLNGDLKPSDFSFGSRVKVWWLCPKGHEYQATIGHRTGKNGTSCPICNSQRQTSFAEQAYYYYIKKMYPDTINRYKCKELGRFELDIFIPSENIAIEYDGEAWHKENKIERERQKYEICKSLNITLFRVREGEQPSYWRDICDNIFCITNMYKHEILNRAITYFLNYIKPIEISYFSPSDPLNLLILPDYNVNVERDRFDILKFLKNDVKNSIIVVKPELLEEWHPTKNKHIKPEFVQAGSDIKYWWRCKHCGNDFEMSAAHRKNGSGCPICASKFQGITSRMNKVRRNGSISNPILLKEWNYSKNGDKKPEFYTRASEESVWWKCSECGYEWKARISNREHGRGCPCCSHKICVAGKNDLLSQFPDLALEWDFSKNESLLPDQVVTGSKQKVWWICPDCGHSYKAPVYRRTSQGSGCRKCADKHNADLIRKTLIKKKGSFGDNHPQLLREFSSKNAINPFEITNGYKTKVLWKCSKCGHEWSAVICSRIKGHGCPECARKRSLVKVINEDTGIVYESITVASRNTGIDGRAISANCRGRTKQAGGFRWKYI